MLEINSASQKSLPLQGLSTPPKSGWLFQPAVAFIYDEFWYKTAKINTQNIILERDLPSLQEVVNATWKKEGDLEKLKSELSALERKIQLTLIPRQGIQVNEEQKSSFAKMKLEKCTDSCQLVHIRVWTVKANSSSKLWWIYPKRLKRREV